jgi:hypothetical protein
MSMMKNLFVGPRSVALAIVASCSALAGCEIDPSARTTTKTDPAADRSADEIPASPVTPDEVLEPRSGSVHPADYVATEGHYRLFGVELGDGTRRRAAIIADARGWSTRAYEEGEPLGRGMRVAKIDERSVTLHGAHGDVVLEPGLDVRLRVVRHRLDVVARPLGRHRFALDAAAARAAPDILPSFERRDLQGAPVLKLGPVVPGSLFAEADFREGDLVAVTEGSSGEAALADIARALRDGRTPVSVRLYRAGVPLDRTYTPAP